MTANKKVFMHILILSLVPSTNVLPINMGKYTNDFKTEIQSHYVRVRLPGIKLPVKLAVLYLNFLLQQPHIHGSGNNITDHSRLERISGVHLVLSIYSPAIGCPGPCPGFWIYPKVFHNCSGQHVQALHHFCSLMLDWRFTCSSFCTLPFVLLLRAVEKS